MGTTERKEREKAELKEQILTAAKKILLREGQEGLSIRKIAADIEYSPATIYLYFKDRDAIMYELMEMGFMLMNRYMVSAFAEQDPVRRIHEIGRSYIHFGLENKDWYDLMFNSDKPMKHIEKCMEDWDEGMAMFNFLCMTCKEAIDKLQLKGQNERILALHLWSSVHGLVNLAQTERLEIVERHNNASLIAQTLDSMMQCIFKI
ncbi:MAG: TetR/AcrR family transcriptional regulator [Saprospiraceae bacterium]|nr:TetR/AcrR family transcriptional regulator [Saprospiraceae bacterium]HMW40596.1 TetR/AcrR family transcriptional regulator [Saprospiraceae bacterium]HMX89405.1 TetR/AcrR family transcriptional regulator [Saprospiraceae bacterium]HMZ39947.1 TetR/AcrR family transcriptional regulator [Saprospiraceae bacterium]HNA64505.1 TetR/AcrR family transcriptional regulator [Saprospiraceae bacterium]